MRRIGLLVLLAITATVSGDGPGDNLPDKVRRIPPPGVMIPDGDRVRLQAAVEAFGKDLATTSTALKGKSPLYNLLPDVEIYYKAVEWALKYNEFYNVKEVATADELLKVGRERLTALRDGKAPWTTATGVVVRGYRSKIDDSVQPYGLVVPDSYAPNSAHKFRLDFWFHGRGENLSELSFISQRSKNKGEFAPANTFVLHPYGRYCCANKFAGETDSFEALAHAQSQYPLDENRLVVRGFSMGGAACWQYATHFAGKWAAAAPGAGFAETADFLKVFQNEPVQPTAYEKKLWHWYDATDYAVNLFNCPTVAYSGEIDKQKQAADIMAKAMTAEGLELVHIIGPKTGHSYHKTAKEEINRRIDAIVEKGRNPVPPVVKFTTFTLRYPEMLWVRVEGLGEHWNRARVEARIVDPTTIDVKTENVTALTLNMAPGQSPLDVTQKPRVRIDGKQLEAPAVSSDRSWRAHFSKTSTGWTTVTAFDATQLRKEPGLTGPIDDAFMDRFVFVRPTGQPQHPAVGKWATAEFDHAVEHWRRQYRGHARVIDDKALTDADIADSNLVLWGDPQSNAVLAKIIAKLPLTWTAQDLKIGGKSFDAATHTPLLIYPNPLNPKKYVVLNSSFTFREYDYLNNARQIAKLPDYAIIDVRTPVTSRLPGTVTAAGFFDEAWKVKE